jgi:hypothetical protein
MGDWLPEKVIKLEIEEETTLYFWTMPNLETDRLDRDL